MEGNGNAQTAPISDSSSQKPICGIVMPISAIDGCSEAHWSDVKQIFLEAVEDAGFEGNLVSNADDVGIIQKRIIQNLYDNPILVCDVSGKNPNVMFELGMRLAFDRPTIIVKDDQTSYSFDTSPIEHLEYPRDLRFSKIVDFKSRMGDKVRNTHQKAMHDPTYTTFLKNFGEFKVAKIEKTEVSGVEFILEELKGIRQAISTLDRTQRRSSVVPSAIPVTTFDISHLSLRETKHIINNLGPMYGANWYASDGSRHLVVSYPKELSESEARRFISASFPILGQEPEEKQE